MMRDTIQTLAGQTFAGIHNFRDFGGYETTGGQRVRKGKLFRSAHFGQATPEDIGALDALGVSLVVDLRTPGERERVPSRWPGENAKLKTHDVDDEDSFFDFETRGRWTADHARDFMIKAYDSIPFEARYQQVYRDAFEGLLNESGGLVVHCMAGKDRTGILCALIQHALGVPDQAREQDYMLTNSASNIEAQLAWFANAAREKGLHPMREEAARILFSVHQDYLNHAFSQMRVRHGSVDAYLSDALQIGAPEKKALRERLLE